MAQSNNVSAARVEYLFIGTPMGIWTAEANSTHSEQDGGCSAVRPFESGITASDDGTIT
jgi:hypothetical protein